MDKRLFIVDGHAYAYRAFYAIRQLTSPTGAPTNAIYGFIRMLGKMRAFLQPSHLVVVWDGGLSEERMQLLPEYKTHRPSMPSALEQQLDEIVKFLQASRIASYMEQGIEADDWIATVAKSASVQGFSVVIASSDKDFMQLVSPQIGLLNPNDKEPKIWTAAEVRAKTGVEPEQVVDWLALVGDSVDNIPGVPGVGSTTATKLLQQFGTISVMYERLAEIKSARLREALTSSFDVVARNRKLVQLHQNLGGAECCDDFSVKGPDLPALRGLYRDWGFKSLGEEVEKKISGQGELL